jgi:hypothetical protein
MKLRCFVVCVERRMHAIPHRQHAIFPTHSLTL